MMYQVELSEAALKDLQTFTLAEALEILGSLQRFEYDPKPNGVQVIPLPEAANGVAYCNATNHYNIFYNIFEKIRLVKIVAIFKRINLN